MSDEESSVPEMKDLTSTSFGYLIAFLLPGIFGLYALTYWFPQSEVILQPVLKADATVGPSAVFLIIAVGMGLCISALRFFMFEKFLCRKHHLPADVFAVLTAENRLTAFKAVVDEHYRYHQFYGGCATAVLILFAGWAYHHRTLNCEMVYIFIGFVLLELLLGSSARDSFIRYIDRGCVIVTGAQNKTHIAKKENGK